MRTAVVTGAGSGVGRAAARALARAGWRVALVGRHRASLQETAAGDQERFMLAPFDVSDARATADGFGAVQQAWGRLDLLFNNAGAGAPPGPPDETTTEDWLRVVGVNLNGAFFCAREAFGIMRRQSPQGGRIINNGSVSAHAPRPGSAAYTASKHAVTGLTKALCLDGRPFDIAASQIDIGNAETAMTKRMSKGVAQADGSIKPEPCMDVSHVADMIVHMAGLPLSANVQTVTVMATKMPFIGRG